MSDPPPAIDAASMNEAYDPQVLTAENFHFFIPRSAIRAFLVKHLDEFHGRVIDLGCGFMPYRELILSSDKVTEYLPIDIVTSDVYQVEGPIRWDGGTIPFEDRSIDTVVTTELFEHLSEPLGVASEVTRVLRPSGLWVGTVPFIWPVHEAPHDHQRFTPFALRRLVEKAGAAELLIEPLGGMDASFAQVMALWLASKPAPATRIDQLKHRLILRWIRRLLETDTPPDIFRNESLFTGLGWTARCTKHHV